MATKNKFAGRCAKCGQTVQPGEGTVSREWDQANGGRWVTVHNQCPEVKPSKPQSKYQFNIR